MDQVKVRETARLRLQRPGAGAREQGGLGRSGLREHPADDLGTLFDGIEVPKRLHHAIHVEPHVFVHEDIAEPRQKLEAADAIRAETIVFQEGAHCAPVVLEALATSCGQLTGDDGRRAGDRRSRRAGRGSGELR